MGLVSEHIKFVSEHIKWYNNKTVDKGGTKHLL